MAGYTAQLVAANDPTAFIDDIIAKMTNGNGTAWFTRVVPDVTVTPALTKILLKSTSAVDEYLNTDATQEYRLLITLTKTGAKYTSMTFTFGDAEQIKLVTGGGDFIVQSGTPKFLMVGPENMPSDSLESNYRMTFTPRGFALAIWATSQVNAASGQSFCVFQRPVNPTTGEAAVSGKAPIFALWSAADNSTSAFTWGIVREKDVSASIGIGSTAVQSRYNMFKVSLDWAHPNLFDNNAHVVKFPYGFATHRHLYLDELDMMCMVNASAFAGSQDVKITMYGESAERTYRTTWGDVQYGLQVSNSINLAKVVSGARIGILTVGGGI